MKVEKVLLSCIVTSVAVSLFSFISHAQGGWYTAEGESYYLTSTGALLKDRITPDNYYVDESGAWVSNSNINSDEMKIKSQSCRYIVFNKTSHYIELWQFGEKTHTFIATSGYSNGDKEYSGDKKTPEGEFLVCMKNPFSKYHLAIGVGYPTNEDAERGLASQIITLNQYQQIVDANMRGSYCWDTPLGGWIEFHGNRQITDLTSGCIGMRDEDIDILYSLVEVGDKIWIQP